MEIVDGKAKLRVNGELIDQKKITKVSHNKSTTSVKPLVHETMNYLSKKVEIDTSRIQISEGKSEVLYNNTVANPGKTRIAIYGPNSEYIKTVL